jgi:putative flippase GtrA
MLRQAMAQGGAKALKYSAVSVIGVLITQSLILAFHGPMGLSPTVTNLLAVSIASVPAYFLNRAWVWGKRGRNDLRREVLPFWGFNLFGLALSTVVVAIVANWWSNPLAVNVANIGAFGLIWVAKYLVLDTMLFGDESIPAAAASPVEVAPLSKVA